MSRIKNLAGQQFGKLTAVSNTSERRQGSVVWHCVCECGAEAHVRSVCLVQGITTSCGCATQDARVQGMRRKARERPAGQTGLSALISVYKRSAKERKHDFLLTREEFAAVCTQPCAYCGVEPKQQSAHCNISDELREHGTFLYNGLDRVDNNRGYVLDNVVPCCRICNRAKHSQTMTEFTAWLDRLVAYQGAS